MQDLHISTEQKQISNHMYESLYSKADILYFQIHPTGRIESCNVTVEDVLEYDKESLIGQSILNLVSQHYRDAFSKQLHLAANRGFLRDIDVVLHTETGHFKSFKVNGLSVHDDNGHTQSISLYMKDQSEIFLLRKQQRLSELILEFAGLSQKSDVHTHEFLKSVQSITGCETVGWFKRFPDNEISVFGTWMQQMDSSISELPQYSSWSFDVWYKILYTLSGYESAVRSEGKAVLVHSLSRLATHELSNEIAVEIQALSHYESILLVPQFQGDSISGYFLLLDTSPHFWEDEEVQYFDKWLNRIVKNSTTAVSSESNTMSLDQFKNISNLGVMLTVDGEIQDVNEWIISYLQFKRNELLQKRLTDLIPLEYQEIISDLSDEHSDTSVHDTEVALLSNKGKRRRVLCTSISHTENNKHSIIWFFSDKESEHVLKNRLVQARKMEALGMLASGIVHDFKNLLSGIEGYSSLLCEDIPEESPFHEDVQQIGRITQKAIEQTARLLAFSEGGNYMVDGLIVNDIIREVATMLSRTTETKMIIRAELEDELKPIKADASQIQHAILQISLNSRDAMASGGKLIFHTKNVLLKHNDPRLKKGIKPGSYVTVSISDTGIGMNNLLKSQMFDPFFTTKNKAGGKGLGLQIVKEIIEKHHGFYTIFSEQGQGTVFKIFLPAEESDLDHEEEPLNGKAPLGKEHILLIDNNKVLRNTTRKMLSRYGYKVISAESSHEALQIYKKNVGRIDMILYDVSKPESNVDDNFQLFKKMNPKLKIVVTSNIGEKNFLEGNSMKYISGHIEKPFKVRTLLKDIRRFLNG